MATKWIDAEVTDLKVVDVKGSKLIRLQVLASDGLSASTLCPPNIFPGGKLRKLIDACGVVPEGPAVARSSVMGKKLRVRIETRNEYRNISDIAAKEPENA